MRHPLHHRLVALALSWAVPATTVWSATPPVAPPPAAAAARLPETVPGLAAALSGASATSSSRGASVVSGDEGSAVAVATAAANPSGPAQPQSPGMTADRHRRPVTVHCECVEDLGDGRWRAHFGYESQNANATVVSHGPLNFLSPLPATRGQLVKFLPGRSRPWPNAPWSVVFDGNPLTWSLRGPDGILRHVTASKTSPRCGGGQPPACESPFWGPKRYTRTHGAPNVFTESVAVPASAGESRRLTVVNGEADGSRRVSSARILVNGAPVVGPHNFSQQVGVLVRPVTLTPTTTLTIELSSAPGSFLTLSLCGPPAVVDHTAPRLSVVEPVSGAVLADPTPALALAYEDLPGAGEPSASGVDSESLAVTLDGVDRTALFAKTASGATAEVPADAVLAEGGHRVEARVRDLAGNQASAVSEFLVDTIPPAIAFSQPGEGQYVSGATIDVAGTLADASPIVRVAVAGREGTVSGSTFTVVGVPVGDGPDVSLEAEAEDAAGHVGRATLRLRVDRRSPTVTITRPTEGEVVTGPVVEVEGTVDDDSDVTVEVNGQPEEAPPSLRAPRGFRARVPVTDGLASLVATARDAAGNTATATVSVRTDTVPPAIVLAEPATGLVTKDATVRVAGAVTDTSAIASLTVAGVPVTPAADGSFEADVPLGAEGPQEIVIVAVDTAGNTGTTRVTVAVDRTAPSFAIAAPAEDALLGTAPVVVLGTVEDPNLAGVSVDGTEATVTGAAWRAELSGLGDGPRTFTAVARDRAGNEIALSRRAVLDLSFPVVAITAPADGTLLREGAVPVGGTVRDATLRSVAVNGVAASVSGDPASPSGATFTVPAVALAEGENAIEAVAEDGFQRSATARVRILRDSLPPIVALTTPDRLLRGRVEKAVASVTDGTGSGVARVVFSVNGAPKATLGQPPFEMPLEAPEGVASGETITVSVQAFDLAGNASEPVSRAVAVVSEGVVTGHVLADETSLPLAGATVRLTAAGTDPVTTDARGLYALPAESATALVVAEAPGRTSVERELPVAVGAGSVPVDARLTLLAEPVTLGAGDTTLTARRGHRLDVVVPAGAAAAGEKARLTGLSPQGLPGLLPLGWSPLFAFDLRAEGGAALVGPLPATVTAESPAAGASFPGWPDGPVSLAEYRPALHAWVTVETGLLPTSGTVAFTLPGAGAFALVVADAGEPAVPAPAVGEALTGVPLVALPATATSAGLVEPAILPPAGGTATGTLLVDSPLPLPSGTVVQAQVTETFSLASGETASEEERSMDIVLFRAPCTALSQVAGEAPVTATCPDAGAPPVAARVPITPSRTFGTTELLEGRVHLDILAGRESARGTTGGQAPVVVESGAFQLAVAAQALPRDTAFTVREEATLSAFLPAAAGYEPLAEAVLDFAGAELGLPAELSVAAAPPAAGDTLVVARVERVDGIPRLAVVALAAVAGERLVTQPSSILPGVRREGRHVFYRVAGPVGFVRGVTSGPAGPVKAVVTAVPTVASLPFIAASEPDGRYVLTTPPATGVLLQARVPGTPFEGTGGPVDVTPGEARQLDLTLAGGATTLRVTPPNGSAGIAVNVRIELVPSVALDPASVTPAAVRLARASDGQDVPVRLVPGVGGRSLSVIPQRVVGTEAVPLEFATAYTLTVTGLRDAYGTEIAPLSSRFTTAAYVPPVLDATRIVFSAPDEATGLVTVSAPAGSFPPGTTILIVNSGNGVVLSLTADNDGAVSGELPASVDDRLLVTVTDPLGNAVTFERSQYVIDPATGETAVGAGGGVVTSPEAPGFELRVPPDAVDRAVRLKLSALSLADFEALPALPDAEFGAGMRVDAPEKPAFGREVDLVFPLSSLPEPPMGKKAEDAHYAVVREIRAADGTSYFQTIDEARVECAGGGSECAPADQRVVTASFPFPGFLTPFGALTASFGFLALETSRFLLMRSFAGALPGRSPWGVITGRVLRPVPVAGKPGQVSYQGVAGCTVRRADLLTGEALAETTSGGEGLEAGRFTFTDPRFTGGTVLVKATCGGKEYSASAYAVSGGATGTVEVVDDAGVKRLLAAERYPAVGFVNITLPAEATPAPAPRVEIRVFREEGSGARTDTGGVTVAGTPVQVGVRAKGYVVRDVKIRGESQTLRSPDPLKQTKPGDPLAFDVVLQDAFVPPSAGSYTISATALDPAELASVTGETVVQVLAEPGGGTVSVPGRPGVLGARTTPKDGAKGVSVAAFPQVSFTEPVRSVSSTTVRLLPAAGDPVPLRILGVTAQGQAVEIDDTLAPSPLVVSLTLQPLVSLIYGTAYRLELTEGITDEDGEALVAYGSGFTTFLPEEVGQSNESDPPTVTGLAVLGERGYVLETLHAGGVAGPQQAGLVRVYDVTDPGEPRDLTDPATGTVPRTLIAFPPRDIAGEEVKAQDGSLTGEKLIAVAAAPRTFYQTMGNEPYWTELKSTPSNLFLYDVTEPDQAPRWVGAANLTNGLVDGIPNRIAMREGRIYAATFNKGIQVVALENLRQGFPAEGEPTGPDLVNINKQLFAGGLNPSAVVLTIPVRDPANGPHVPLNDVKAGPLVVAELPRTVVLATGSRPGAGLVVADGQAAVLPPNAPPGTQPIPLWQGELRKEADRLDWGSAVALARVDDRPLALVGGYATLAGAGSQTALAVVDLTPMAAKPPPGQVSVAPTVLGFVKLEGLQGVGDILLVGNTAIVSGGTGTKVDGQPGGAALVDLTDPENAVVTGLIPGIGSRMALDPNGMLLSSDRSFLQGTSTEASGVRTAALSDAALITKVDPDPVVVSASNEVFRNVDLAYKTIPPAPGTGEVRIDVHGGARVATLPAAIDEAGTGTARWPQGTVINPLKAYEARLYAELDGQEMRSFPKRLRFEKVPLAITTRDRVLRIQFALPEQGLFSFEETKYSVRVYLAPQGQEYPANPSFAVSSTQIAEAYPNTEVWFEDVADGTAKAEQAWVTRKIDRMDLPPGTDTSIRRQAFEIGAILGGYPQVRVVVVGEESGTELVVKDGVVSPLGDWSEIISRVNDQVRKAAGHFVPVDPILPAPGTFDPAAAFAPLAGLTFRAVYWLLEQNLHGELLRGLVAGFNDGWTGDKDTVVMIGQAAASPLETAKAVAGFLKDFVGWLGQSGGITGIFKMLFEKLQQISLPTLGQAAYYTGYLVGFLFEQVLAALAIAAVTGGIGALVAKAASLLRGVTWLASLARRTQALLRSLAYALDGAKQVVVDSRVARTTLGWLKEIGPVVDDLWKIYPDAGKILQKAGKVAVVSKEVAQRAIYWLTTVDRMVDDAAVRFVTFFEKVGKEAGDRWLTRWTGFRNGKRAVKDGFEATLRSGDLPENVQDVLVTAADLNPPGVATKNYPREHWDKYQSAPDGDRAESSLARLKRTPGDTRFDDEAIGETVKFHSRADVPPMSDDAIEGTGRLATVPCLRVAALTLLAALPIPIGGCGKLIPEAIAGRYANLLPRFEKAMENLKRADDVAADEAFARMFWAADQAGDTATAEAVIRAASFPLATPKSVAEYMKAIDFMRDGEGRIITGLLDPPPGVGATVNVRRVGNRSTGSIAEGWEPVAIKRLIEDGSPSLPRPFSRADIKNFGEKLDITPITGGSPRSIEADCLLTDGTFFDMKHSLTGDPQVTEAQVDLLTTVLLDTAQRPIERAIFVANAPVGQPILDRVRLANDTLKRELGITEDLIHVVEDLGGFPLP